MNNMLLIPEEINKYGKVSTIKGGTVMHYLTGYAINEMLKAQLAKALKPRLDRPELRKALRKIKFPLLTDFGGELSEEGIDLILALKGEGE